MNCISKLMKNTIIIILFFLISFSLELFAQNNTWYVKKNASGLNNGTNWLNAWNELDQIDWNVINPGDQIFISGGISSLIYSTTMTINKSGLPNKFIVITKGRDSENNGEVIIDGQGNLSNGILISRTNNGGLNYIRISNLTLINHSSSILVKQNANVIYLDSLKIRGQRDQGAIMVSGWNTNNDFNLVDSVFIRNCDIRSDYQTSAQTDNIYVQYANNIFILNNTIQQLNTIGTQHNDCIQTTWYLGNQTFSHNFIYNAKENDSQGMMMHTSLLGYKTIIDNNVIYSGGNGTGIFEYAPYPGNVGDCKYYNNTFYVKGTSGYISQAVILAHKNVELKNNIFVSNGIGAIQFNTTTTTSVNSNHNLFKSSDDRYTIVIDGYGKTLSYWQGLNGQDLNSFVANPLFVNVENRDISVQEISPAVDAGVSLEPIYSISLNGVLRPQGAAWDIGAHEFFEGTIVDITSPELVGAELLDSVSLLLEFSELMNESSVENTSNYAVNNGVNVLNSEMLNGTHVRLTTSVHSSGIYQVSVNNVTDIAGNTISSQSNSMIYEYFNSSANLVNLPVVQANADNWYLNYTPDRTIDGITGGESRWGGSVPMPDTIVYNLNDIQILNQTKLSFYAWESGRIYNYSIQVSIDSINWTEIKTNIPSHSAVWSIEGIEPIEAKFIRVILLSNNQSVWAGLWEAEFWGHLKIPTNNEENTLTPVTFNLEQNYPNPFNPTTKIRVHLPESTKLKLTVYNLLGEIIYELSNGDYSKGIHEFSFKRNESQICTG